MNKPLKLLYFTNGILFVAGSLLGPLYALFAESFSASAFVISLTWATLLLTSLVTYIIISITVKDEESANINLVLAGAVITSISWLLFVIADSITHIFIIQALLGIGGAIGEPSWLTLVAKHLDKNKSVHDYAEWNIIKKSVGLIAIIFGGAIITELGFKTLFGIMAAIGIFSALLLLYYKPQIVQD